MVDVGSGAGFDSLIAARMVGPAGQVVGVDMTLAMLARARAAAEEVGLSNVEFRQGYGEVLPKLQRRREGGGYRYFQIVAKARRS